ncbi:class I glutamine amidotransferase-like protein [Neoconidiobolus thromboides FSU 785]|nr:class I glutamine amidotransferase-like protein [Neoconidiobolus thromboides FSU 785]
MLDLVGPAEIIGDHPDVFETVTIGLDGDSLVNSWHNSLIYHTKLSIKEAKKQQFDLIVTPGGVEGTNAMIDNKEFIQDFTELYNNTKVVFTVCTGALILAKTGLLNGFKATTNKQVFFKKTPDYLKVDWVYHAR